MLVRTIPITNGSCKPSPDADACATPTTIILKAMTHFAKLSRYFDTNETSSSLVANATTVPIAAPLNPSYMFPSLSPVCDKMDTSPKTTPKKGSTNTNPATYSLEEVSFDVELVEVSDAIMADINSELANGAQIKIRVSVKSKKIGLVVSLHTA